MVQRKACSTKPVRTRREELSGSPGLSCAAGLILADLNLPNYFLSFPNPITVSSPVDQYRRVFLLRLCHSQLYSEGFSRTGQKIEEIREETHEHQQIHAVKFSILTHYQVKKQIWPPRWIPWCLNKLFASHVYPPWRHYDGNIQYKERDRQHLAEMPISQMLSLSLRAI